MRLGHLAVGVRCWASRLNEFHQMENIAPDATTETVPQLLVGINLQRLLAVGCVVRAIEQEEVMIGVGKPARHKFGGDVTDVLVFQLGVVVLDGVGIHGV